MNTTAITQEAVVRTQGDIAFANQRLLNATMKKLDVRSDAALARVLKVAPPVISKTRSGNLPMGITLAWRICKLTDWTPKEVEQIYGSSLGELK